MMTALVDYARVSVSTLQGTRSTWRELGRRGNDHATKLGPAQLNAALEPSL